MRSDTNQSNWAVIVAAGHGTRMGGDLPKQFMQLGGEEILSYSVNTFLLHPAIHGLVIVTSQPYLERVKNAYQRCRVVLGGVTRQESSANGVAACPEEAGKILIHDAARPFVSQQIINECLAALDGYEAAAPVLPLRDTVVMSVGTAWQQLDRENLKAMQTPQGFQASTIRAAHASGVAGTDEIGLVLASNPDAAVHLFEGTPDNFKITTSLDLELAAIVAARWHS
ncbi:MAG: 2-C-methyl-D-erythritol 4-phosphate cytidylyltransferase [Lentisphaeria bacterium]|nr:2-C-methyl-D-erythritol 4-phosphate cytidylyltransferase [Candidatus Neomarinimicrobiota bacterium]MCF7843031.1 2-C-methyl-D-erythritol 4-phosphate cytidylyltransferase [Lentisphaeria bacterium]